MLTNGRVHSQREAPVIENLVNHFMLLTAGSVLTCLCLCGTNTVNLTGLLSPTHTSPRSGPCWQDVCDKGSGLCVCYVSYSHNIHHHSVRIHHLFATGSSDPMEKIHYALTALVKFTDNEPGFLLQRVK